MEENKNRREEKRRGEERNEILRGVEKGGWGDLRDGDRVMKKKLKKKKKE